ncbi:MAG: aminotransferase class I/II-fold pyridoxal phosphate-dependent enzyme [Proteobacteria bacterium]|nr:MAG: aminotransferase class I/II-fold pyridoxal phosphate-dependent enzyme [Pseudomonadota bacterium]
MGCIAHVFAGPTRSVLAPKHAYPFFRSAAEMSGARFDTAPEKNAVVDVDALLQNVKPDTGIMFIANPANPTGTRIPKRELQRLRKNLRDDILLVIDEAYGEFADHLNESTFDMVSENTAVLRTLSKAYGMAGYRVGWGVFAPTIRTEVQKVMNPNNISCLSQAAAVAAITDQAYMRVTCELTAELAAAARHELSSRGFKVLESFTNFVLIDLKTADHAIAAETMLLSEGVVLRRQAGAVLPHCLRMTLGHQEDVSIAIKILKKWKQENPDA